MKKFISMVMAAAMVVSLVPATAFAADEATFKVVNDKEYTEIVAEDYDYFTNNLNTLTDTERKIYELYLDGKKAAEISELMGIKPNTIKFHNKNIYSKLGISSRKQHVKYATIKKYQDTKDSNKPVDN